MDQVDINLRNTIQSTYCVDTNDGEVVYRLLKQALDDDKQARLSFEGVELVVAAFLNVAVGQLFHDFSAEYVDEHLCVYGLHPDYHSLWGKTIHHTPHYYKHREEIDRSISNIIEE